MIRVLVCEDSPTCRALLVEVLSSSPDLQVVGEAADGIAAVAQTQKLRPDVVTMDIRMPRLDGLAATKEIMITAPTPVVIVTAHKREQDVTLALEALRAGAVAILEKPLGPQSPHFPEIAQQLVSTVRTMSQVKVVRHFRPKPLALPAAAVLPHRPGRIVTIATSTGGPPALQCLLGELPADFPVPILVVQHITAGFTPGLVGWLGRVCSLRVKMAEHGEALLPGRVYFAPDDRHLGVRDTVGVALSTAAPIGGFRPSGTFLFESAARAFGAATIAVILTGMGDDGVAGLHLVRQAGGRILAQDENSSVIFGMPKAAIDAGLIDQVLPLEAMAPRLRELV